MLEIFVRGGGGEGGRRGDYLNGKLSVNALFDAISKVDLFSLALESRNSKNLFEILHFFFQDFRWTNLHKYFLMKFAY